MRLVGRHQLVHPRPLSARRSMKGLLGGLLSLVLVLRGHLFPGQERRDLAGLIFFRPEHMVLIIVFGVLLGSAAVGERGAASQACVEGRKDGKEREGTADDSWERQRCLRLLPSTFPSFPTFPSRRANLSSPFADPRARPRNTGSGGESAPPRGNPGGAGSPATAARAASGAGARRQRRAEQSRAPTGVDPENRHRDRAADRGTGVTARPIQRRADSGPGQSRRAASGAPAAPGGHLQAGHAPHLSGPAGRRVVRRSSEAATSIYISPVSGRSLVTDVEQLRNRVVQQRNNILNVRASWIGGGRSERPRPVSTRRWLRAGSKLQSLQRSARNTERRLTELQKDESRLNGSWPRGASPPG